MRCKNNILPELEKRIEAAKDVEIYETNFLRLEKQKLEELKEKIARRVKEREKFNVSFDKIIFDRTLITRITVNYRHALRISLWS